MSELKLHTDNFEIDNSGRLHADSAQISGESIKTDKQLMESPEVEAVAKQVIADKVIELGPADVGYFLVYPNISKKRAAKAMKASREVKHFSGYDFLIEISGELWDMLDNQTKYNLLWNQLLHCDASYKSKTGEWSLKIVKPQYTDYYQIADSEGSEWHKAVQATASSLYDMDPKDEGQVSLF